MSGGANLPSTSRCPTKAVRPGSYWLSATNEFRRRLDEWVSQIRLEGEMHAATHQWEELPVPIVQTFEPQVRPCPYVLACVALFAGSVLFG